MADGIATDPFLSLEGIGKRFGGTQALKQIDWNVLPGEIHCLAGENGSGKSTLIKIVAGVHRPDPGGRILVSGERQEHLTPQRAKALGIQVIYQDLSLFPNLTVLENIAIDHELGSPWKPVSRRAMRASAAAVLQNLDVELPLGMRVASLPVAQRQLVAICRGLAVKARLVFMDEPTASLTRHEVTRLLAIVSRLKALGVAVVFVSHRLEEVAEIAERVTVLRDGALVGTYPAADVDHERLVELMTGSRIHQVVAARPLPDAAPILELRGASRAGEFKDVSFTLRAGEVLGITGRLGAGRTELALALFGMTRLDGGAVTMDGKVLKLGTNQDAIEAGIAYLSEDRLTLGLNLRQSIADNIAVAVLDDLTGSGGLVPRRRRTELADKWVVQLGIKTRDATLPVHTLSGGNQQRVVLAKWLATGPKVLILDSPTVGVDIRNKQGMYDQIRQLADAGMAILLISDEISEVYFNSDRVLHMRAGRIVGEYVPGRTPQDELAEAVYA